jgi:hypothetical protein
VDGSLLEVRIRSTIYGSIPPASACCTSIDYRPIFEEAAKAGVVKHCFVEQEGYNVPPMQGLKIDADYMHKLGIG